MLFFLIFVNVLMRVYFNVSFDFSGLLMYFTKNQATTAKIERVINVENVEK